MRLSCGAPPRKGGEHPLSVLGLQRAVVPEIVVLHEVDTLALHGARDHAHGSVATERERVRERLDVVSVDLSHDPAEALELRPQRLVAHDLVDGAESLQSVGVHDRGQRAELEVRGKRHSLPDRTLVELAVTQEAEGAPVIAVDAISERATDGNCKAMSERSAAYLDARKSTLGEAAVGASVLAVLTHEAVTIEHAPHRQCSVERGAGMPLAQYETVAGGPVVAYAEAIPSVEIEDRQDVGDREGARDVARPGRECDLEDQAPQLVRFLAYGRHAA